MKNKVHLGKEKRVYRGGKLLQYSRVFATEHIEKGTLKQRLEGGGGDTPGREIRQYQNVVTGVPHLLEEQHRE